MSNSCVDDFIIKYHGPHAPLGANMQTLTGVRFNRVIDDISEATLTYTSMSPECRESLASLEPWAHKMSISTHVTQQWKGYVVDVRYGLDTTEVVCWDLLGILRRRRLMSNYVGAKLDATDHVVNLIAKAEEHESVEFRIEQTESGITSSQSAQVSSNRYIWDLIRDVVEGQCDIMALGDMVLVGKLEYGTVLRLDASSFVSPPTVTKSGSLFLNQSLMTGRGSLRGIYPEDKDLDAMLKNTPYPLVQDIQSQESINDKDGVNAAAKSRYEFSNGRVPIVVNADTDLQLVEGVAELDELIPGRHVSMSLQELGFNQSFPFRMSGMRVEASAAQMNVFINLQPVGSIDVGTVS